MSEQELAEMERKLEHGNFRPEDVRLLIHEVRALRNQLDTIQRILSGLQGNKRSK